MFAAVRASAEEIPALSNALDSERYGSSTGVVARVQSEPWGCTSKRACAVNTTLPSASSGSRVRQVRDTDRPGARSPRPSCSAESSTAR